MRVGIIGAGNIAKTHAKVLDTIKGVQLVGVYDIDQHSGKTFADHFDIHFYEDIHQLFDDIQSVIIASPNFCHCEQVISAIDANLNVLCEKPMATSIVEAEQMIKASQDNTKRIRMGFNYRYLNYVSKMKSMIDDGTIGDLIHLSIQFKKDSALRRKAFTWKDGESSKLTSGAFGDLGVHLIDLIWYLTKDEIHYDSIRAKIEKNVNQKEERTVYVDDHTELYFMLESNIFANIVTSKVTPKEDCGFSISVIGSEKEIAYDTNKDKDVVTVKDGVNYYEEPLEQSLLTDPEEEFHGWTDSFRNELIDWLSLNNFSDIESPNLVDGIRTQIALSEVFQKNANQFNNTNQYTISAPVT